MPVVAELHDGRRLEFPDGTDPSVVQTTVKRLLATQSTPDVSPATGWEGVGDNPLMIGAGKKVDSILDGLTQLYLKARGEDKALSGLEQNVQEKEAQFQPQRQAHPITTAVGEALPSMAVPLGAASGLGFIAKSAAANALPEVLTYGSPEDRLKRGAVGAVGGAVGGGFGLGMARLLRPAGTSPALSPEAQAAAKVLGYELSPGQVTQNPALQSVENYLSRSPGSAGAMQAKAAANQAALDSAAARAMGQNAELGEAAFGAAKKEIGASFRRLEGMTSPSLGDRFLDALAEVDANNAARATFRSPAIDDVVNKAMGLAEKGQLTGQAYKEIRSELASQAWKAGKNGDSTLKEALGSIVGALDTEAKASLANPADRQAWDVARSQWNAYKLLSKGNVSEAGHVNPARLAAALRGQSDALRTGSATGELADIARLGEALKGVPNPTSGQLSQMQNNATLTGLLMSAGNKAGAAVYNQPLVQKYLAQGLLEIGPDGKLVIGKAAGALGAPATRAYLGAE